MIYTPSTRWDAQFDVIVVGFGGAGAGAARFAADNGAHVLLIDSAPEGHEGGNTRYSGGAFAWGLDSQKLADYYKQTYYPFKYDVRALDCFVKNITNMKEYAKKYFDIDSVATGRRPNGEYPEYQNANSMQSRSMNKGMYNGFFWKLLRKKVYERLDMITIWYESPALHLIQDAETNTTLGVQIKRKGQIRNIRAKNGVVLSCGGFENNQDMVQTYLGQGSLAPIGTLYNKGKGIDLAIEANARLWHMSNYDSHGLSLRNGDSREKFAYMINWKSLFNGSIFVAGDDGTRYFKEDEEDRHGYKYNHGNWIMIPNQNHPHIVMDQAQYEQLSNDTSAKSAQIKELISYAIKADSIEKLAKLIDAPLLPQAVKDFNFLISEKKRDMFLNRDLNTMRAFEDGPYYAIKVRHNILHTHGGAQRNEKCEVIDMNGNPIPHLYEAGELGDIFATKYLGANSIADLLISGKIAGENAARTRKLDSAVDAITGASLIPELHSDAQITATNYETKENQEIGISSNGISDFPIVVRVTGNKNKLEKIEVLQQKESPDVGGLAIPKLTKAILQDNTADVDSISGASATSGALKEAVKEAWNKLD